MVVYGTDCIDEISLSAPTKVCEIKDGAFSSYEITPEQFGLTRCKKEDLQGGTPEENAKMALAVLKGEKGPKTDAVILNAAAGLHIATGCTLEEGVMKARAAIEDGTALKQLEKFIELSNRG